jgi:hypothetical protein
MRSVEDKPSQLIYNSAAVVVHSEQCSIRGKSSPVGINVDQLNLVGRGAHGADQHRAHD